MSVRVSHFRAAFALFVLCGVAGQSQAYASGPVMMTRTNLVLQSHAFGGVNSLFQVNRNDSLVHAMSVGDVELRVPTWDVSGSRVYTIDSVAASAVILNRPGTMTGLGSTWTSPVHMSDRGAIVLVGTYTLRMSGLAPNMGVSTQVDAPSTGGQAWAGATGFGTNVDTGSTGRWPNHSSVRRWRASSPSVQSWGGNDVHARTIPTIRFDFITLITWVPEGASSRVRHTSYISQDGPGQGGVRDVRDYVVARGAWMPAVSIGGVRHMDVFRWASETNTAEVVQSASLPLSGTIELFGTYASGVTTDVAGVGALHVQGHSQVASMTALTELVPTAAPGAPADPLADDTGGAWGEWLTEQLNRVTQPVTNLVNSLFWWLKALSTWGEEQ